MRKVLCMGEVLQPTKCMGNYILFNFDTSFKIVNGGLFRTYQCSKSVNVRTISRSVILTNQVNTKPAKYLYMSRTKVLLITPCTCNFISWFCAQQCHVGQTTMHPRFTGKFLMSISYRVIVRNLFLNYAVSQLKSYDTLTMETSWKLFLHYSSDNPCSRS